MTVPLVIHEVRVTIALIGRDGETQQQMTYVLDPISFGLRDDRPVETMWDPFYPRSELVPLDHMRKLSLVGHVLRTLPIEQKTEEPEPVDPGPRVDARFLTD